MNITTIGGGTGTTSVLLGLKKYNDLKISAIVSMMDDGGSNRVVRDQFGLLPLSDVRKAIIALAPDSSNKHLRSLFNYRFSNGEGLSGHTLGNLMMIGLSKITGSEVDAIQALEDIFRIKGDIIPVTTKKVRVIAKYEDGTEIVGENEIDTSEKRSKIIKVRLSSKAKATKEAIIAIREANYVIIGPGDLYTSIIPNILVTGIAEEISKIKGKLIVITNLMTKLGETQWMKMSDYVKEIERYCRKKADYIIVNNGKFSESTKQQYLAKSQTPFEDDLPKHSTRVFRMDLILDKPIEKEKGDTLPRSIVRHDPEKLGKELYAICRNKGLHFLSSLLRDSI